MLRTFSIAGLAIFALMLAGSATAKPKAPTPYSGTCYMARDSYPCTTSQNFQQVDNYSPGSGISFPMWELYDDTQLGGPLQGAAELNGSVIDYFDTEIVVPTSWGPAWGNPCAQPTKYVARFQARLGGNLPFHKGMVTISVPPYPMNQQNTFSQDQNFLAVGFDLVADCSVQSGSLTPSLFIQPWEQYSVTQPQIVPVGGIAINPGDSIELRVYANLLNPNDDPPPYNVPYVGKWYRIQNLTTHRAVWARIANDDPQSIYPTHADTTYGYVTVPGYGDYPLPQMSSDSYFGLWKIRDTFDEINPGLIFNPQPGYTTQDNYYPEFATGASVPTFTKQQSDSCEGLTFGYANYSGYTPFTATPTFQMGYGPPNVLGADGNYYCKLGFLSQGNQTRSVPLKTLPAGKPNIHYDMSRFHQPTPAETAAYVKGLYPAK